MLIIFVKKDNGESPEKAVLRELEEECHLKGSNPQLLEVRGEPDRDPRYHAVSIVYRVDVNQEDKPQHDDDAGSAEFYSIQEVKKWGKEKFFADHFELLQNALKDF
ncbi:NUDIX hydrolase domain protein [Pseudocohnilembus persalinus]|uniref:NUDIX hydrolase domain protein n=1 Tax=Pseudocohnilembus persalinus TaxID=266149 RepID=A0A0V0R995_PSEPJ|nr:NUDIX hydrolase domain protein [Pseudocohnilembus persalinus]|eukprot:KRX11038.1 NUDIX hydrolase domain protein [Pseudocohnilembus persalinus]